MDIESVKAAGWRLDKIKVLDELERELSRLDIDFCDGERRRPIGRNQMDERKTRELKAALATAFHNWFTLERAALRIELKELGVEIEDDAT